MYINTYYHRVSENYIGARTISIGLFIHVLDCGDIHLGEYCRLDLDQTIYPSLCQKNSSNKKGVLFNKYFNFLTVTLGIKFRG